ncbi:hypothetical protein F5Y10DRAFT_268488 [Nemania abortiva]|nr:hypothetical protein F5Y10DRAFT_268488 [Nemania abortiva]
MDSSPSVIQELRHFSPGLTPALAKRRYGRTSKTRHLKASWHNQKRNRAPRIGWDRDERDDGRHLASDPTVTLPGERLCPRLRRQEAFRAPQTWDISDTDVVVSDAELYRLGILYDDDDDQNQHVHGSGFCLDAIVHKEPVYSLRPAKRAKRTHGYQQFSKEDDLHLSVNLLSTYLSDDAAIAQFFAPVGDEERAWILRDDFDNTDTQYSRSTVRGSSAGHLAVIHELDESSTHLLTPSPAANDFPDLVSDTEEDEEVDSTFSGDWALVLDPNDNASISSDDTSGSDTDVDVVFDHDEETTDAANGAWVFLAGDDS